MIWLDHLRERLEHTARSVHISVSEMFRDSHQPAYSSAAFRQQILHRQQSTPHLRVPVPFMLTPYTPVLAYSMFRTIKDNGGETRIPKGTQLLMAAVCAPFTIPHGVSMTNYALSPFMVWEHHQQYVLIKFC